MPSIDWTYWLSHYGYAAVLVFTFLEGESILVAAAVAAHSGYLDIDKVLLCALIGSFVGDQLWFFVGRTYGRSYVLRRTRWRAHIQRVHELLDRYHAAFILGFRFLYGLRTVSPLVLGMSSVPARRFVVLNFIGAVLWTLVVGGMGYAVGQVVVDLALGSSGAYILVALLACALAGAGYFAWQRKAP